MRSTDWLLIALVGFGVMVWGWWLWRDPSRLRRGPKWIRVIQARLLLWRVIRKEDARELTDKEIKSYAKRVILGGLLMSLAGLAAFIMGMLE